MYSLRGRQRSGSICAPLSCKPERCDEFLQGGVAPVHARVEVAREDQGAAAGEIADRALELCELPLPCLVIAHALGLLARVQMRIVDVDHGSARQAHAQREQSLGDPGILPRVEPAGVVVVGLAMLGEQRRFRRSISVESPAPQSPQTIGASRSAIGLRSWGLPRLRIACVGERLDALVVGEVLLQEHHVVTVDQAPDRREPRLGIVVDEGSAQAMRVVAEHAQLERRAGRRLPGLGGAGVRRPADPDQQGNSRGHQHATSELAHHSNAGIS